MMRGKKSATEKQAARRFGKFVRSVRRNLRQAHRILERSEQAVRLCYEKAGVAMLDAKATSGMNDEGFAAWLAPLRLSQDCLHQCLELGQVALDRRHAGAAGREESLRGLVKDGRDRMRPEAIGREGEQWARQPEEWPLQELRR
jgi:hypothetical protein